MTNKIGPMDQGAVGKVGNKAADTGASDKVSANAPTAGNAAKSQTSTNDTVKLTSAAKLLERLEKTLDALPAVDATRVAEVKTAIESGDYQIDADAIAAAMIRFERSLGE